MADVCLQITRRHWPSLTAKKKILEYIFWENNAYSERLNATQV